jgi:hypothetical protein
VRKSLWRKGFIAFLGHADLSVSISEYRGFADGRDTPDTGHDGSRFGRPLDGRNAPEAAISRFLFKSGGLPYNLGVTGRRFAGAMRDTVMVPPKTTVTVAFDADNPGWWPFHCHLLYHQHAGMFSTLRYD